MLSRQTARYSFFFFLTDLVAVGLSYLAAFLLKRHVIVPDAELDLDRYLTLLAVAGPFITMMFALSGVYTSKNLLSSLGHQFQVIVKATVQAFIVLLAVSFYTKIFSYPPSRLVFTFFLFLLPPALMLPRLAMCLAKGLLNVRLTPGRRVLVIGGASFTEEIGRKLAASPYLLLHVSEAVGGDTDQLGEALRFIEHGRIGFVVVDLPFEKIRTIVRIVERAEQEGIGAYVTPRVFPPTLLNHSFEELVGLPLIAFRPSELSPGGRVAKRTMDIVLSLAGLIVLSPLMAVVAVLVKATSKGPVIFKQARVGMNGMVFTMFKFRSMRQDAEAGTGPRWATSNDERCTRVGSFLRRTGIDELPQLLNVLLGSMSLVGPRPERPELVQQFKSEFDRYVHKHWVRPGITGWAQVNGWRGDSDLATRIQHDIYYIENWSIAFDIRILFMTMCIFRKSVRGAAGSGPGNGPARQTDPGEQPETGDWAVKVALAHHWLVTTRGGEKVLEAIAEVFPDADLFTLVCDPGKISESLRRRRIVTSWLNRLPGARALYPSLLPLHPFACRSLNLESYDLVISSDSALMKGVRVSPEAVHICYCHSPPRYLWGMTDVYLRRAGLHKRMLARALFPWLRRWDRAAAQRVDYFIANSQNVRRRIRECYGRDATVIYPPVDEFTPGTASLPRDYYLVVGQLVPYKRVDLAIRAFSALGKRLVIIGDGPEEKYLRSQAGPTVEFLGWQADEVVRRYLVSCKALIFAGEEDFGMVPVEAQMAGRPVIAYRGGGALETVVDGVTGLFFDRQDTEALIEAVRQFEGQEAGFSCNDIRSNALRFGRQAFLEDIRSFVREKADRRAT